MIRHRSRMFLAAALACALSASVAASVPAQEFTHGPSWKAPAAHSAHASVQSMPVMVAELPALSPASAASSTTVGRTVAVPVRDGAVLAMKARPREKPRLWG